MSSWLGRCTGDSSPPILHREDGRRLLLDSREGYVPFAAGKVAILVSLAPSDPVRFRLTLGHDIWVADAVAFIPCRVQVSLISFK